MVEGVVMVLSPEFGNSRWSRSGGTGVDRLVTRVGYRLLQVLALKLDSKFKLISGVLKM
jgi:hypothetical protein